MSDDVVWDDAPASNAIQWDDDPNTPVKDAQKIKGIANDPSMSQQDKARALVNQGQTQWLPEMATAAGHEIKHLARTIMNGGMKALQQEPYDWASDKAISDENAADKAAGTFRGPGAFGKAVTDTATSYGIGGGLAAGGTRLAAAASPLEGALGTIARTATSSPVRGAVEGATSNALMAEPGERGDQALLGGLTGGAMAGTQSAGSGLLNGIVKKNPALRHLEDDVKIANSTPGADKRDLFVPISQGADPKSPLSNTIGKFYRSALPFAPGVEGRLKDQSANAADTIREVMLQGTAPEGTVVPKGQSIEQSTAQVGAAHDQVYNNLRKVQNIKSPKDFRTELASRIATDDPEIPSQDIDDYVSKLGDRLDNYTNGTKNVSGWNLRNLRDDVDNTQVPKRATSMQGSARDYINDIFGKKYQQMFNLKQQPKMDILDAFQNNTDVNQQFSPLQKTIDAAAATRGKFRFGDTAVDAPKGSELRASDQDANEILNAPAAKVDPIGRMALYGLQGATLLPQALGPVAGLATHAGITLGANALASKAVQKGLYGDYAPQKFLSKALRNKPQIAAGTRALVEGGLEQDDR